MAFTSPNTATATACHRASTSAKAASSRPPRRFSTGGHRSLVFAWHAIADEVLAIDFGAGTSDESAVNDRPDYWL
jgi:hypothetical protein